MWVRRDGCACRPCDLGFLRSAGSDPASHHSRLGAQCPHLSQAPSGARRWLRCSRRRSPASTNYSARTAYRQATDEQARPGRVWPGLKTCRTTVAAPTAHRPFDLALSPTERPGGQCQGGRSGATPADARGGRGVGEGGRLVTRQASRCPRSNLRVRGSAQVRCSRLAIARPARQPPSRSLSDHVPARWPSNDTSRPAVSTWPQVDQCPQARRGLPASGRRKVGESTEDVARQ